MTHVTYGGKVKHVAYGGMVHIDRARGIIFVPEESEALVTKLVTQYEADVRRSQFHVVKDVP